jgi:hypothetical protein
MAKSTRDTYSVGNDVEDVLAIAVNWAETNIPPELLPRWVFQGEIALAHARGLQVSRGWC